MDRRTDLRLSATPIEAICIMFVYYHASSRLNSIHV